MRSTVFATVLAGAGLWVAGEAAAQPVAAEQPRIALVFAGGVRDAGDLGDASWIIVGGLRGQAGRSYAWTLTATHTRVDGIGCPDAVGMSCVSRPPADVTTAEAGLEFLYGTFRVQPYGAVSVGAAHLRREGEDTRWGFAYSTGLGVSVQAARRVWLFAEGRWRQESFSGVSAWGPTGLLGARLGI